MITLTILLLLALSIAALFVVIPFLFAGAFGVAGVVVFIFVIVDCIVAVTLIVKLIKSIFK